MIHLALSSVDPGFRRDDDFEVSILVQCSMFDSYPSWEVHERDQAKGKRTAIVDCILFIQQKL